MNFSRLTAQKSCPKFMVITLGLVFQAARYGNPANAALPRNFSDGILNLVRVHQWL